MWIWLKPKLDFWIRRLGKVKFHLPNDIFSEQKSSRFPILYLFPEDVRVPIPRWYMFRLPENAKFSQWLNILFFRWCPVNMSSTDEAKRLNHFYIFFVLSGNMTDILFFCKPGNVSSGEQDILPSGIQDNISSGKPDSFLWETEQYIVWETGQYIVWETGQYIVW